MHTTKHGKVHDYAVVVVVTVENVLAYLEIKAPFIGDVVPIFRTNAEDVVAIVVKNVREPELVVTKVKLNVYHHAIVYLAWYAAADAL